MTHGNAIIDGYGIEFSCKIASLLEDLLYLLTNVVKMGMSGYKLGEGVGNTKNG